MSVIVNVPLSVHMPEQTIEISRFSEVLGVQAHDGVPHLWLLANPERPLAKVPVRIIQTGKPFDQGGFRYVGTVQLQHGELIVHVFVGRMP